jgi:hypothetical protein
MQGCFYRDFVFSKTNPKRMKLLVDSGSTKADWIAIDDNGKVLFTTQISRIKPRSAR